MRATSSLDLLGARQLSPAGSLDGGHHADLASGVLPPTVPITPERAVSIMNEIVVRARLNPEHIANSLLFHYQIVPTTGTVKPVVILLWPPLKDQPISSKLGTRHHDLTQMLSVLLSMLTPGSRQHVNSQVIHGGRGPREGRGCAGIR